ncbi:unnamed protein product [Peronospora belbahrii]|uniref:Phosphatidate cytidylyltransferase n=1 Tax=Peronospora belbahrii TaxID=622444 RepID=A0ABN8CMZ8_9STRA|nr:unnamed protein product [Peronospora belbahrii]
MLPQPKTLLNLVHRLLIVALGALVCVGAGTGRKAVHDVMSLGAMLTIFTFHIATARKMDQTTLMRLLLDLFALLYIVNGFSHAILVRYSSSKYGLGLQILGLCCAWVCDSGALVAGSFMGDAKLASVVSPGKTRVGAIAGVLSSIVTVLVMFALPQLTIPLPAIGQWTHELLPSPEIVPLTHQILLGIVVGVLCILGDLVESFVKRVAGVKDSGSFFPGHGGCLDRLDSVLLVAPFVYFYSHYFLSKPT